MSFETRLLQEIPLGKEGACDDCLAKALNVIRQQVNQYTNRLAKKHVIVRKKGDCEKCGAANKYVNSLTSMVRKSAELENGIKPVIAPESDTAYKRDSASQDRTYAEIDYLNQISKKIKSIKTYLVENDLPNTASSSQAWSEFMLKFCHISGNIHNMAHFTACLLAKDYLIKILSIKPCDAALKPQGASGLDIDEQTTFGERIIAEIKTTEPYLTADFGASQKKGILDDIKKLQAARADHKFLFVTCPSSFDIIKHKYLHLLEGIKVVLLT